MIQEDAYRNLSDKEQAILKLPVFFDGYDNFYHPIRESVTNCRDILTEMDSENGIIEVILHDDNRTITIKDNGCGIILDGESNGKPNWEHAFLILFSGSKMSTGKTSGGTNGCGNTIINYSSDLMDIISKRNGKIYHIQFINGGEISVPFECLGDTEEHGTEITFKLCDKIYTNTVFDENEAKGIVERIVVTSQNITSIFKYKDQCYSFNFKDLSEYLEFKEVKGEINNIVFTEKEYESEFYNIDKKKDDIEKTKINLVVNFSKESVIHYSFLNGIYMPQLEDNTVHDGVINGIKESINAFIKNNGLYDKKEKQITKQDVIDIVSYICSVSSTNVSYTSQTKFSTKKELYEGLLKQHIKNFMESYFIENKEDALKLANSILISKRAREKSEISRKEIKKQLEEKADSITTRPNKFVPCRSKEPSEIIYIVIEGDGAMNSIKLARNPRTMCIQPLKGKPINPFKCKLDELLNNDEVLAMYKVWNCGIEYNGKPVKGMPKYNFDNLQVNDIIAYTDFDWDGWHIQCLLIGILYRLSPDLLKRGKFYIGITPLYVVRTQKEVLWKNEKTKELLAYSENEYSEMVKYLNENNTKFKETRFKGLGGLPVNIMARSLNPETRILKQITMDDVEKSKALLELFLSDDGDNQQKRKEFIEQHSKEFFDYSLFIG